MRSSFSFLTHSLMFAPTDVNSTAPRTDIAGEAWPEGDLPEQMGGAFVNLMPGIDAFRLPVELGQLWAPVKIKDPRSGAEVERVMLKLDKNHPMVIVGGKHEGETLTANFSSNPRPRGKKDDPATPWVSDLAYLLEVSLGDKSRPKTADALKAAINKHAGKIVRLDHGLSGQCRTDKVRYILQVVEGVEKSIPDPTGEMGCGKRFYTRDFKNDDGTYSDTITCDCSTEQTTVALRGFPSVDRFLPPAPVVPAAAK